MAWSDIKSSLETVKSQVGSLKATADLTSKDDTLERVDAAGILQDCKDIRQGVEDIEYRATDEQELTELESSRKTLASIRNASDVKVQTTENIADHIATEVFSSVKIGQKVTRTRVYNLTDGVYRLQNKTYKVEDL